MSSMIGKYTAYPRTIALTLGLILMGVSSGAMAATNMSHAHIGHVVASWNDTPEKMGLLPTAIAEAKVAAQHAGFAVSKPDDLAWMKSHIGHVLLF